MRHIKEDVIKNKPIRKYEGKFYYFDKDGIYRCVSEEQLDEKQRIEWEDISRCFFARFIYLEIGIMCNNVRLTRKAISKLKVGDTLEVFDEYLENTTFQKHNKPENLDRFIAKINNPIFQRIPENFNKDTFDYIFIEIMILSEWEEDRLSYIYKNQEEILKRA